MRHLGIGLQLGMEKVAQPVTFAPQWRTRMAQGSFI